MDVLRTESTTQQSLNHQFSTLLSLICEAIPLFQNYPVNRIAVNISKSRGKGKFGIWAHVIPLRYFGGSETRKARRFMIAGTYSYDSAHITKHHPDARYMMTFMIPRFFILTARERLETIVHELYHLHPSLRGDLRRFPAPHIHHGPTPAKYRQRVHTLASQAAAQFPELLSHPLLTETEDYFSSYRHRTYQHPRRKFKPSLTLLFSFLGLLAMTVGCSSQVDERAYGPSDEYVGLAKRSSSFDPLSSSARIRGQNDVKLAQSRSDDELFGKGFYEYQDVAPSANDSTTGFSKNRVGSKNTYKGNIVGIRQGLIYREPNRSSKILGKYAVGDNMKAIKQTEDKAWVLIESGNKQGWIEKSNIASANDTNSYGATETLTGAEGAFVDLKKNNSRKWMPSDKIRDQSTTYLLKQGGKFYEEPTDFANRFGLLQQGDEVNVLETSTDAKWTRIKLILTSEDGWVPSDWIKAEYEKTVEGVAGPFAAEFNFGYGSKDYNYGFDGGVSYNIRPEGFERNARDRLEIGGFYGRWQGIQASYSDGVTSTSMTATFQMFGLLGRWVLSSPQGFLQGALEGGVAYNISTIAVSGISSLVLSSSGLDPIKSGYGALVGLRGYLALTRMLNLHAGGRLYMSFSQVFFLHGGLTLRF